MVAIRNHIAILFLFQFGHAEPHHSHHNPHKSSSEVAETKLAQHAFDSSEVDRLKSLQASVQASARKGALRASHSSHQTGQHADVESTTLRAPVGHEVNKAVSKIASAHAFIDTPRSAADTGPSPHADFGLATIRKDAGSGQHTLVLDDLHEEGLEGVSRDAQATRTVSCELGQDGCTSMCRWLKLTEKEIHGRCQLFELQLKACDYAAPEERADGSSPEEMDCAVRSLRTAVHEEDVADRVEDIEECIGGLPTSVNTSCRVGLGLLRSNIEEWRKEAKLKNDAEDVARDLAAATTLGRKALKSKSGEQEAIDALSDVLGRAERVPGHYLVEEVHAARVTLDRLPPVPAARVQVERALEEAGRAFETTELFKVKEASAWLQVALDRGERYRVGDPLARGKATLKRLLELKASLLDLHAATFWGNVSMGTKSDVRSTTRTLAGAIDRAKKAGLKNDLLVATELLEHLQELTEARLAEKKAAERAQAIVVTKEMKTKQNLDEAIDALNVSIGRAQDLGLGHNKTTSVAVWRMDQLLYIREARKALYRAQAQAQEVLSDDAGTLNDDREEIAIDILGPAIKWAEEVGLTKGLPHANQAAMRLEALERAKERMAVALEFGNATLKAQSATSRAIRTLEQAVKVSDHADSTAGVPEAERMIEELRKLHTAKMSLRAAEDEAREAFRQRSGYEEAMSALKESLRLGRKEYLRLDDHVALEQMRSLETFAKAEAELMRAVVKVAPEPLDPQPEAIPDERPRINFRRIGLKPIDLPSVPKGMDDQDADFGEHEEALEAALRDSAAQGLVDPKMKAQLASERAKEAAHAELQQAIAVGDKAVQTKHGLDFAIKKLSGAVEEAAENNMSVGASNAQDLLKKLKVIQPARDELHEAILKAQVSARTVSGMDAALVRLDNAVKLNKQLELYANIHKAEEARATLENIKMIYVRVKAAITQGRVALETQEGEEAAIEELDAAIEEADEIGMHRDLPRAVDILHELLHMNAEHQQLQAAMTPRRSRHS